MLYQLEQYPPYHLENHGQEVIEEILNQDFIKEHPISKQALMTSNIEIITESDGNKRITVDVHKANKTKLSPNLRIPKQEGIKTKEAKANIFSKLILNQHYVN